jgi:hypothetical protein
VDQGFILYSIVGGLVVDLQDILELFSLRETRNTPAPAPSRLRAPSKYII